MAIDMFSVVALLTDLPEHGLVRGHVGAVVDVLEGDVYDVEFVDNQGQTYALAHIPGSQLLALRHECAA